MRKQMSNTDLANASKYHARVTAAHAGIRQFMCCIMFRKHRAEHSQRTQQAVAELGQDRIVVQMISSASRHNWDRSYMISNGTTRTTNNSIKAMSSLIEIINSSIKSINRRTKDLKYSFRTIEILIRVMPIITIINDGLTRTIESSISTITILI